MTVNRMGRQQRGLLTRMGAGRKPDRPIPDAGSKIGEISGTGGQRWCRMFEIAQQSYIDSAQTFETLCIRFASGKTKPKALEETGSRLPSPTPARSRAFGHAAVDQNKWKIGAFGFEDQMRPDLGFDQTTNVWPPMGEEAPPCRCAIDRRELMESARRQSLGHQAGRCQRAGRHQNVEMPAFSL